MKNILEEPREEQSEEAIHELRLSSESMSVDDHQRLPPSQECKLLMAGNAIHGNIYQVKYLMLILYRAWKRGHPFYLGTEVTAAGKFDDVVLAYRDDAGNDVRSFVQVKHKQNDMERISADDLLADDVGSKPFSILKYFKSWRKIKDHPEFTGRKSKHFILYTNIDLDMKSLKEEKIEISDYIRVKDTGSESKSEVPEFDEFLIVTDKVKPKPLYNLRPEKESKLHRKLDSVSDVNVLARELARRVYKDEKIDRKTAIFKDYSAALAKEIIDTRSRKLCLGFVENDNNLSKKAKKFRSIFLENIKTLFKLDKMYSSDENIWKELEKKTLNICGKFCGKPHSATTSRELPDDDMSDEEIFDFFGEFVWAVNQPNEEELGEIIRSEIDDDSKLSHLNANVVVGALQEYMLDWLKKKSRKILVKEDANNFFNEIEFKLSSPIAKYVSFGYTKKLDECGIRFECENTEVRKFVNSNSDSTTEQRSKVINSSQTFLTALRVHQTLMTIAKFKPDDSVIFITLESLLSRKTMDTVLVAFKGPQNYHLLIVDCEIISAEQCRDELWDSLHDVMKENTDKKMILIIQGTGESKIHFKNSYTVLPEDNIDYNINRLEKSSQQKLLKRKVVKFQGRKECFGRLFGIDVDNIESEKLTDLGRIINPRILVQLIKSEEIKIGGDIPGLNEIKSYYIPRRIDRHVVIKEDILKASGMEDLLAIGGVDRASSTQLIGNETVLRSFDDSSQIDSQRRICFVLDHDREAHQFKVLCQQNADRNIHWLQRVSEKLIWIRSHGDVSNLVKYKDTNQGHLDEDIISRILSAHLANDKENEAKNDQDQLGATSLDEDDFAAFDKQRRIVILSDIAGMGKTSILTYLAQKIKDEQPSSLVITLYLTQCTNVLNKEKADRTFGSDNIDGKAVNFLVDKLGGLGTDLERQVYKKILNGDGEAALLFDGFDEISLTHGHIVVELLQALVKKISIKKIIVTTRPHTSEALEMKLRTFSYSLQPFSPENQKDFLKKFWKQGISGNYSDQTLEARLEVRAERGIKLLDKSVRRKMMDFTGVPLQLMMLAHIYRYRRTVDGDASDETDERIAVEDIEAELPEKIDIIDLYEKFVDEKFNILLTHKQSGDSTNQYVMSSHKSNRNIYSMQHQKFALEELFENQIVSMLLTSQPEVEVCIAHSGKSNTDAEQVGLVTLDSEGKPQFIHRTFAEYFAATILIKILKNDSRNQQVREFFVAELFLKPQYKTIRAFLDWLLLAETDAVENESWKLDLRKHHDEFLQTVYHVAVNEYNFEIIKFFLTRLGGRCKNDSEKQDNGINIRDLGNLTPLASVIRQAYDLDVVKLLVEGGADIHWKGVSNGETLLHVSVEKPDNFAVVEYLCEKGANPNCQNKQRETPLHLAVYSRFAISKVLIPANTNCQNERRETPLHLTAYSPFANSEVVKYLCEKGANPNRKDNNGETPLHLAVSIPFNLEVVKYLCERGANPNCRNGCGQTPLHLAVSSCNENLEVVKYLCKRGADINREDIHGMTPLRYAVARPERLAVVRYLCHNGASVNCRDITGKNPLDVAVLEHNDPAMVKYLRSKVAGSEKKRVIRF